MIHYSNVTRSVKLIQSALMVGCVQVQIKLISMPDSNNSQASLSLL